MSLETYILQVYKTLKFVFYLVVLVHLNCKRPKGRILILCDSHGLPLNPSTLHRARPTNALH